MNPNAPAMVLAAGRGQRMRPLTDATPKPLLSVRGKPLMQWMLEALRSGGCQDVVVNTAWLGDQISAVFGEQPAQSNLRGLRIAYSHEGRDFGQALETAGGIARALPLLGSEPFLVVNADVYSDYDFAALTRLDLQDSLAHLVLVDNPPQHPRGDFAFAAGRVREAGERLLTYSGIGVYAPRLFAGIPREAKVALAPLLRKAIASDRVSGEHYPGRWHDIGTAERLSALDAQLKGGGA